MSTNQGDMLDPRVEALMSRRLDGEISPDEDLELNRALLRSPVARSEFDLSTRLDALATTALAGVGAHQDVDLDAVCAQRHPARPQRWSWYSWSMPLAAAACLVFAMTTPNAFSPTRTRHDGQQDAQVASLAGGSSSTEHDPYRLTGRPVDRVRRDLDRDLLGVIGDDGRVYWVEVDHERTVRKPSPVQLARAGY